MATFTITLPDAVTVTSRGMEVNLPLGKLTPDMIANLVVHGATQKVSDAASGAKAMEGDVGVNTVALMQKAVDGLVKGEWSQRGTGAAGVDEETLVKRSIMRGVAKAQLGSKSEKWTAFTGLTDAEQNAKLDAMYAKNEAKLSGAVETELKLRAAKRASKASIKVDIDL